MGRVGGSVVGADYVLDFLSCNGMVLRVWFGDTLVVLYILSNVLYSL